MRHCQEQHFRGGSADAPHRFERRSAVECGDSKEVWQRECVGEFSVEHFLSVAASEEGAVWAC